MLSSSDEKIYECAFDDQFKHLLKRPLSLSCGHSICTQCSSKSLEIKCRHCNELNKNDLKHSKESQGVKFLLDNSLQKLFSYIETRLKDAIDRFKGKFTILYNNF